MRHTRLPILFVLIAAALAWLHFALRSPPGEAPAPTASTAPEPAPKPAIARPATAMTAAAAEPPPPTIALPPTIEVAPLKIPPGDDPAPEPPPPADETNDAKTPPIDANRAAELFADLLARQDTEPADGAAHDPARELWKRYDGEPPDDTWAPAATARIEGALDAWLDALPEDAGDHVALVRVECRATLCQVLAADNDAAGRAARADAGQEWQQAIAALHAQPWWNESGFGDATVQVLSRDGYELYAAYLPRTVTPERP